MSTSSSIPGSPATNSSNSFNYKHDNRPEIQGTDVMPSNIMQDLRNQVFQGQLYKFTNVVKGNVALLGKSRVHIIFNY